MTAPPFARAGFPESEEIVSGEPQDDPGTKPDIASDRAGQSIRTIAKGFWLTGDAAKVAKDIDTRWNAQNKAQKTGLARGELNERRRAGDPYSKLVKDTDHDTFRVYTPRGIEQAPPSLNKSDDLSVKVVANIYADPPKPECEPASDSDEDRSSAEFSTRVLMNESTESGMNIPDLIWDAEDVACSWGSGFVYAYVDPQGGGHRPKEIMAPPAATAIGPDGQPVLEVVGPTGVPVPIDGEPVIRYIAADGRTITDDPNEAMIEWLPTVCGEVLNRKNLRFLPEMCTGIRGADGVLIAAFDQLGDLKAKFPAVATMPADDLTKLVTYRPDVAKLLMPKHAGNGDGTRGPDHDASKGPPDDALVLTITGYKRGSGAYPLGAYVVMGGGQFLLHRQEWCEEIKDQTGKLVKRAMDIPVAQFRQFKDTKAGDPHGRGLVDRVGDGDPLVSFAIGAVIEYLHRVNNPHLFVPIGSGIQPKSLQMPRGTPIPFNPAGGGKPQQEEIASLPQEFMEFIQFIRADQDSVAGLQQAAQGVASASVQSGKHAQQIIEQALVALGGMKQGADSGYMRLCRIVLQLIRKYYTTPMRIKIVGEDGAFKEREWMGSDLGTTTDVKIMAGTSTMMTASAKSMIALEKLQVGAISLEDFQRAETGNVRALIGAQDNPHKLRVAGQISAWNDGPPEDWQPPQADPNAIDPTTGQPLPPPIDPANPFADSRPVDFEISMDPTRPGVAAVRHAALSRALASTKYKKFNENPGTQVWAGYLLAEYEAMRQAAGVQTMVEQQQAAQAQMAAAAPPPEPPALPPEPPEQEHARVLSLEDHKAAKALELKEAEHRMAMEAKLLESELAAQASAGGAQPVAAVGGSGSAPAAPATSMPAPPPNRLLIEPFDSEGFRAAMETRLAETVAKAETKLQETEEMLEDLKQAVLALTGHAMREQPPVVVPAPVVNVPAPVVNVPAPVINLPRQPRPQVTVEAPEKPTKKKGTITGPDGQQYTVEVESVKE